MAIVSVLEILIILFSLQFESVYCSATGYYYFYATWYFWFGLFWIIAFIIILIVGCIKKKNRKANRISTVAVVSGNAQPPLHKGPVPPPSYGEPSYQPPPYQASAPNQGNNQPNQGVKTQGQAMYPPTRQNVYPPPGHNANTLPGHHTNGPTGQNINLPAGQNAYPPPPPANIYSQPYPSTNDPAYPPNL